MTRPKHPPRRLGFKDGLDDPDLEPYRRTPDDVQDFGRWLFLGTIARDAPAVLSELAAVRGRGTKPHTATLAAWAERWGLGDDWCLAYACATWRAWRRSPTAGRSYWWDRDDRVGYLVDDTIAPSERRPLTTPEHFGWLVEFQCGRRSYTAIAEARRATIQTVAEAVATLAARIGLTLRPTRRGRPRKDPRPIS